MIYVLFIAGPLL